MPSSSAEDTGYVCMLEEKWIKKAKDELFEVPGDRLAAVQAFRDWIEQQKHIKCPQTDTLWLLMFLRWSKFSQVRAREKLETYLSLRYTVPVMYRDIDALEKMISEMLLYPYALFPPKRDRNGCQIVIAKAFFPRIYPDMNYMNKSEVTQVNGVNVFIDFSGADFKVMKKITNPKYKHVRKECVKAFPIRMKAFHLYRVGVMFEMFYSFFRSVVPKKIVDRIKVHETMESVYEYIPQECLPVEYLPDDYTGPNGGTMEEISKNTIKAITEKKFREEMKYKTSSAFNIDQSKRPEETVTQHFRKLNID